MNNKPGITWKSEAACSRKIKSVLTFCETYITDGSDHFFWWCRTDREKHRFGLSLVIAHLSYHTVFHVAGDESCVDPPWSRGGGGLDVVKGQNRPHPAVNPDVSSQLLQQNKEWQDSQNKMLSDVLRHLWTHCMNHYILSSPPVCCGVLFSFASLPCTSPSPPPESAPELQREPVSLDRKRVKKISQFKLKVKTFLSWTEVKGFFLTSLSYRWIHFITTNKQNQHWKVSTACIYAVLDTVCHQVRFVEYEGLSKQKHLFSGVNLGIQAKSLILEHTFTHSWHQTPPFTPDRLRHTRIGWTEHKSNGIL